MTSTVIQIKCAVGGTEHKLASAEETPQHKEMDKETNRVSKRQGSVHLPDVRKRPGLIRGYNCSDMWWLKDDIGELAIITHVLKDILANFEL